jgi:DNA-binding MarR family transcriptional regulator
VLSNLGETPDGRLRTREMAARMLWSTSRLSHHVSRMEKRGLVRRLEAEEDARGSEIALTDHGREVLEAAAPAHVASVRGHFIDLLSPEELRVLGDIAEKVVERLARDTPTRSPERRARGRN